MANLFFALSSKLNASLKFCKCRATFSATFSTVKRVCLQSILKLLPTTTKCHPQKRKYSMFSPSSFAYSRFAFSFRLFRSCHFLSHYFSLTLIARHSQRNWSSQSVLDRVLTETDRPFRLKLNVLLRGPYISLRHLGSSVDFR